MFHLPQLIIIPATSFSHVVMSVAKSDHSIWIEMMPNIPRRIKVVPGQVWDPAVRHGATKVYLPS
jgi:hypothetical protein